VRQLDKHFLMPIKIFLIIYFFNSGKWKCILRLVIKTIMVDILLHCRETFFQFLAVLASFFLFFFSFFKVNIISFIVMIYNGFNIMGGFRNTLKGFFQNFVPWLHTYDL
jgi:hypothetical protein